MLVGALFLGSILGYAVAGVTLLLGFSVGMAGVLMLLTGVSIVALTFGVCHIRQAAYRGAEAMRRLATEDQQQPQ